MYEDLITQLDNYIKTNANNEITGAGLNVILNAMLNTLGAGMRFFGIANLSTQPVVNQVPKFYIAFKPGTYTHFVDTQPSFTSGFAILYDATGSNSWAIAVKPFESSGSSGFLINAQVRKNEYSNDAHFYIREAEVTNNSSTFSVYVNSSIGDERETLAAVFTTNERLTGLQTHRIVAGNDTVFYVSVDWDNLTLNKDTSFTYNDTAFPSTAYVDTSDDVDFEEMLQDYVRLDNLKTVGGQSVVGSGDIFIPVNASDVSALPDTTKYGASLSLSINSSTFVITAHLQDQDGHSLGRAATIDLPLESVVVSGSYDSASKNVVLTLQNGSTIKFPIADLVAGLQSEITAQNPLSADLVTNGTTNKVFTAAEKTKLASIEANAEVNVQSDWNQSDNTADDFIKNKPAIPSKTSDLNNDSSFITENDVPKEIVWCTYTETDSTNHSGTMSMTVAEMQAIINNNKIICLKRGDLIYQFINRGSIGARFSCVQGTTIFTIAYYSSDNLWHYYSETVQLLLVSGTNIKTINGNSVLGSGDIDISELPAFTNNAKKILAVNNTETDVEWVKSVTIYSGSTAPSSVVGTDGDIYIQTASVS